MRGRGRSLRRHRPEQVAAASREQVARCSSRRACGRRCARGPSRVRPPSTTCRTASSSPPSTRRRWRRIREVVIAERAEDFAHGLDLLAKLTDGRCSCASARTRTRFPRRRCAHPSRGLQRTASGGPAGTHVHFLDPVGPNKTVWTIGYQDVIAIGPRSVERRVLQRARGRPRRPAGGAAAPAAHGSVRRSSSSRPVRPRATPFACSRARCSAGHIARGALAFLGRYHVQVSVLLEDREREFLHYLRPGTDRFSVFPVFASSGSGASASA